MNYQELDKVQKQLLDQAEKAMDMAYNPYSYFFVGAALLSLDNKIISGANVENVSYGLTLCAERSAVAIANTHGIRGFRMAAVI